MHFNQLQNKFNQFIKNDFSTTPEDLVYIMEKRNSSLLLFQKKVNNKSLIDNYNIYSYDNLPNRINRIEMGIIYLLPSDMTYDEEFNKDNDITISDIYNSDDSIGHYIGYFNHKNLDRIYIIDPLDLPVSNELIDFFRKSGKYGRSNLRFQPRYSSKCGFYVVDILTDLNNLDEINDEIVSKTISQYIPTQNGSISEKIYNEIKVIKDNLEK